MRLNPLFGADFLYDRIKHFAEERGLSGIKLVARADFYRPNDRSVMDPLMEMAEKYELPILFHSGHPSRDLPSLQAEIARMYPNVKIIIAHMGLHDYLWEAIIAAQGNENVYCDMSQAWPYDIKTFIKHVGPDKLLFGTDGPFQSPAVELLKLIECNFHREDLIAILNQNAIKVWGEWDKS